MLLFVVLYYYQYGDNKGRYLNEKDQHNYAGI